MFFDSGSGSLKHAHPLKRRPSHFGLSCCSRSQLDGSDLHVRLNGGPGASSMIGLFQGVRDLIVLITFPFTAGS